MRLQIRAAAVALLALAVPARAFAQSGARGGASPQAQPGDRPPLVSVFTADVMQDLPLGDSVLPILENTQPEVIADRFTSGGLSVGGDVRVGGFLGSWSQTLFRVGDIDISDPSGSGTPLLSPDLAFWQQVSIVNGAMPADIDTPGLAVTMEPRRGGSEWIALFTGSGSGGSLAAGAPDDRPVPIARLKDFANGSAVASGPLSDRARIAVGARLARGATFSREALPSARSTLGSGFAHMVFSPAPTREWRVLGWAQGIDAPYEYWREFQDRSASTETTAIHVQSTFEARPLDAARWRVFAGITQRDRSQSAGSSTAALDRITSGPVPGVVDTFADTTARRLQLGGRLTPYAAEDARHHLAFGIDLGRESTNASNRFSGELREFINGIPARVWEFSAPAAVDRRHSTTVSVFGTDTLELSPSTTLEVGLRGELVNGSAEGADVGIRWLSALPHARVEWRLSERRRLLIGYTRTANALRHWWLAYGDPSAPTATVAAAGDPFTVVSRMGPGTGGSPSLSRIDDDLGRPYTDEVVIGFEKRRSPSTRYTLTGIARREGNLLGVVDTGVSLSGYAPIGLPDAGKDLVDPSDDRTLVAYNRLPGSFGQDAYLVTNPGQDAATAFALRMTWEHSSDRLFTLFGATASAAEGSGGNRGYGPLENDQDVPGELFTNPNANSYARGRLFSDRAFTIKWTTLYRFPGDVTVGGIARYQDGQPFSRMVIVPNLNQGVEAVQAYPNAGSRFTFTGTFDLRVQKGFRVAAARVDAILDAYNLFTRGNEVEEYVFSGPAFRTPTAIEPPHSVHLGLRVTF